MTQSLNARRIILFDGICNLCDGVVHFVLVRDRRRVFHFAPLQSSAGQDLLRQHGLATDRFDSFVLVQGNMLWQRSDAALEVVRHLGFPWSILVIGRIIPRAVRDAVYDWIARNRYRWFGKKAACLLPGPEIRDRFLEP